MDFTGEKADFNLGIDIWSFVNVEGRLWNSGRYKIKRAWMYDYRKPFKNLGNNFLYLCESILALFEAQAISGSLTALAFTDTGFTILSGNFDFFEGRMYINSSDYIVVKLGTVSAKVGIDLSSQGLIGVGFMATAFSFGAYSKYVDMEILVGSIGLTAKFENGKLKFGFSIGWGFEITIKLW